MKTILLVAAVGAFLNSNATDLASLYRGGEVRMTTFSLEESRSLSDLQVLMNGKDAGMDGNVRQDGTRTASGTFTDRILRASDGDVMALTRSFADVEGLQLMARTGPMGDSSESEEPTSSALNGLTVLFTKDEGDFVASYSEDESGDEELLDSLKALLPWGEYLTSDSIDIDDEWDIKPRALWSALHLGGDLGLAAESDQDLSSTSDLKEDESLVIDGEITATLTSIEDGIANITLLLEVEEFQDLTDVMNRLADEAPVGPHGSAEIPVIDAMENERQYDGEGTMLWNIAGGYMVSLELSLDFTQTQTMDMSMEMGQETLTIEQVMVSEGELDFRVEVEVSRD